MTDKHPQPVALSELLDQCGRGGPDHSVDLPQSWTQGRTAFGGLSGALAYQAISKPTCRLCGRHKLRSLAPCSGP